MLKDNPQFSNVYFLRMGRGGRLKIGHQKACFFINLFSSKNHLIQRKSMKMSVVCMT